MKIYSVFDEEFKRYGRVVEGYDFSSLGEEMNKVQMVESGVAYERAIPAFEKLELFKTFQRDIMGGMPVEFGMAWGYNTKLNALEYHRDSEFNYGTTDFILLLAKLADRDGYTIDSSKAKAFRCPKGVMIEVFSDTLHYAPCQVDLNEPFRMFVGLPRGTNDVEPEGASHDGENIYLIGCNKWLMAHKDSPEAKTARAIGVTGENIDMAPYAKQ